MACENYTAPLLVHSCVYVLECYGGRYYVGVSQNLSHRFAQHFSRRGSQMTRKYRPVRVVEVIYGGDYQVEKKTTLEYTEIWLQHGRWDSESSRCGVGGFAFQATV